VTTNPANHIDSWAFALTGKHLSGAPTRAGLRGKGLDKNKFISITEDIFKRTVINIDVQAQLEATSLTEARVLGTASNDDNAYGPEAGAIGPVNGSRSSTIGDSLTGLSGIASLNQDSGSMSNQGFIAAFGEPGEAGTGTVRLADSEVPLDTRNFGKSVSPAGNGLVAVGDLDGDLVGLDAVETELVAMTLTGTGPATAAITGSVEDATGVVSVNNNAGILNNQMIALGVAVGFAPGKAVAHADLAQENASNSDLGSHDPRMASIQGSINDSQGILLVNNAAGQLGNQATVISFAGSAAASF
jgi:hypothetical protein